MYSATKQVPRSRRVVVLLHTQYIPGQTLQCRAEVQHAPSEIVGCRTRRGGAYVSNTERLHVRFVVRAGERERGAERRRTPSLSRKMSQTDETRRVGHGYSTDAALHLPLTDQWL